MLEQPDLVPFNLGDAVRIRSGLLDGFLGRVVRTDVGRPGVVHVKVSSTECQEVKGHTFVFRVDHVELCQRSTVMDHLEYARDHLESVVEHVRNARRPAAGWIRARLADMADEINGAVDAACKGDWR
jgi:hypothetical protein